MFKLETKNRYYKKLIVDVLSAGILMEENIRKLKTEVFRGENITGEKKDGD